MKQTRTPSDWYAGIIAQVRTQTETLLSQFEAMAAPTTPQAVERTAKALLAIVKLADFADRLPANSEAETGTRVEAAPTERPLNRHERRRLETLAKSGHKSPAALPAAP